MSDRHIGWTDQDAQQVEQLSEIIALLREIRDLLKPKPPGRPKKQS
jgi:hypothetical protein